MSDAAQRALLANAPHEVIFEFIAAELERLAWQFILWPPTESGLQATPTIREIGAFLEVIPDVYLHSVQRIGDEGVDRFIRLWCQIHHPDGTSEERQLFCSVSDNYPGPESAEYRSGMDTGLDWWFDIRAHFLSALAARRTRRPLASPEGAGVAQSSDTRVITASALQSGQPLSADDVQQLLAQGDMGDLNAFLTRHRAARPTGAPSQRGVTSPPHAAPTARSSAGPIPGADPRATSGVHSTVSMRELAESQRRLELLFADWKKLREQAYAQRDALTSQLREVYFVLYPVMREAAKVTSALMVEQAIEVWIEQGCPPPKEEITPVLPPGVTPETLPHDSGRERLIAEATEQARKLAIELERTKTQVQERSRMIERTCELLGGHKSRVVRDVETGAPYTVCEQCDARLHAQAPTTDDDWTR